MVEPIFDYQFRLILIGDSTVGKSSLLKYFTDGKFAEVNSRLYRLHFKIWVLISCKCSIEIVNCRSILIIHTKFGLHVFR